MAGNKKEEGRTDQAVWWTHFESGQVENQFEHRAEKRSFLKHCFKKLHDWYQASGGSSILQLNLVA